MGNHSDTSELLEEAKMIAVTEGMASFGDTLFDEFGNAVKLDQSPDETKLANPTKLKDSSGRDVNMIRNKMPNDGNKLILVEPKNKKKKTS